MKENNLVLFRHPSLDPYVWPAMFQHALALYLPAIRPENRESFLEFHARDVLEAMRDSSHGIRAIVQAIRDNRPYHAAAEITSPEVPFAAPWDNWRVEHAIAKHIAEFEGVALWRVAVYAGYERNPHDMALPFRDPKIPLKPKHRAEPPTWQLHIYLRDKPWRPITRQQLEDPVRLAYDALEREEGLVAARRVKSNAGS